MVGHFTSIKSVSGLSIANVTQGKVFIATLLEYLNHFGKFTAVNVINLIKIFFVS